MVGLAGFSGRTDGRAGDTGAAGVSERSGGRAATPVEDVVVGRSLVGRRGDDRSNPSGQWIGTRSRPALWSDSRRCRSECRAFRPISSLTTRTLPLVIASVLAIPEDRHVNARGRRSSHNPRKIVLSGSVARIPGGSDARVSNPLEDIPMDADRHVLFGVPSLQGGLIDARQFAEACTAWSDRNRADLADFPSDSRSLHLPTRPAR